MKRTDEAEELKSDECFWLLQMAALGPKQQQEGQGGGLCRAPGWGGDGSPRGNGGKWLGCGNTSKAEMPEFANVFSVGSEVKSGLKGHS